MVSLHQTISQTKFGELIGVSQQAVSEMLKRGVLKEGDTASAWLHAYCSHLREQAAGRAAAGDLDLAAERAALARVQRERIEMQNAVTRRELAPVAMLEMALASVGKKISATLEAVPGKIKRRAKNLSAEDIEIMVVEITKARNIAAKAEFKIEDDDDVDGDTERDTEGIEES